MHVGVGFELPNNRVAANSLVQNYVYSKLLIDLFAVVDRAIDFMFDKFRLKGIKRISKLTILSDKGEVYNYPYLSWYKQWRNDAAHDFKITEYHELRQAAKDVQLQLLKWGIIKEEYEVTSWCQETTEGTFVYGAYINSMPVLVFRITLRGDGCHYERLTNLTLKEYNDKLGG